MEDIEDCHKKKKYCEIIDNYCIYSLSKDCIHPINNYLYRKSLDISSSKNKLLKTLYDFEHIYTIKDIEKIIDIIYYHDLMDGNTIYYSLYYFEYFFKKSNIKVNKKNIYIIWFLSIMICCKFIFDCPYSNKTFSILFNINLSDLNYLEIIYLKDINFHLHQKNINDKVKNLKVAIYEYQSKTICNSVIPIKSYDVFTKKYHDTM